MAEGEIGNGAAKVAILVDIGNNAAIAGPAGLGLPVPLATSEPADGGDLSGPRAIRAANG